MPKNNFERHEERMSRFDQNETDYYEDCIGQVYELFRRRPILPRQIGSAAYAAAFQELFGIEDDPKHPCHPRSYSAITLQAFAAGLIDAVIDRVDPQHRREEAIYDALMCAKRTTNRRAKARPQGNPRPQSRARLS